MDNKRELIYLAAMLHDIGKFYQRADTGSVSGSQFLKDYCKTESTFCPQFNGRYTHKHVLWTAQFIDDFKPVFQKLVSSGLDDLSAGDNLMNLAAGHHLSPEQLTALGALIKKADCLSSGMDRDSADALRDDADETVNGWDSFKRKQMISILETVGQKDKTEWRHLPVAKLKLDKECFPYDGALKNPDYQTLWNDFCNEFKFIQADTYRAFSETLLSLLLKYTCQIPASTINFADVSLYDHLKTTAALAVCLYDTQEQGALSDNQFLLIGADFSGIQSYLYQIVSKYAGKNLKGRSFYIQLLSDTIVRYLLKELNLFQANLVYNSGGGFYILAPNTQFVKDRLESAVRTIEQKMFREHGTSLYVAIDSVELSEAVLMHKTGSLGDVWGELFLRRDRKKSSRFATLIQDNYADFFEPSGRGSYTTDKTFDSITGEEIPCDIEPFKEGDLILKPLNALQIRLGAKLRDFDLMVVKEGEPLSYWNDQLHISPINLGFTYYFLKDKDIEAKKTELRGSADSVSVITMNGKDGNCNFLRTVDGINNIYGLSFYGGNEITGKQIPTFEELCRKSDDEAFTRLGVLRLDVDNLGSIFQKGIDKDRATLSRYAALSRSFDFFFSGYINTLWRETAPASSLIIYSGGDDVFIVGSWDVAITLAEKISKDFKEYACGNKAFSLSGGIAILRPQYPIMKGAEESANEEKLAKGHTSNGMSKNSLSFMGTPLNWDKEYPAVKKLKDRIVELLDNGQLPKSFISKLMIHYANAGMRKHSITVYKTYWMLTYDLKRLKGRSLTDTGRLIENCVSEVCGNSHTTLNGESISTDYHSLELWTFAARWAELEKRSKL